jgi:hypothetical protein
MVPRLVVRSADLRPDARFHGMYRFYLSPLPRIADSAFLSSMASAVSSPWE